MITENEKDIFVSGIDNINHNVFNVDIEKVISILSRNKSSICPVLITKDNKTMMGYLDIIGLLSKNISLLSRAITIGDYIKFNETDTVNLDLLGEDPSFFSVAIKNKDKTFLRLPDWNKTINFLTDKILQISKDLDIYQELCVEYKTIFRSCYNEIVVTDEKGIVLRINSAGKRLYGFHAQDIIGKSILNMEDKGYFAPSAIDLAIKERVAKTVLQHTVTGKYLIATAVPICDQENNIIRVICNSCDISDLIQSLDLTKKLNEANDKLKLYYDEIVNLQNVHTQIDGIIANSPPFQNVIDYAIKIAQHDSTVLILGESGVGKNVIANLIHKTGNRREGPFIEINCGAIPENLFESELFGYESGAFTGAKRQGKIGMFEMADRGTLFLNEITEMPIQLQVKLLSIIQDKKVTRIGGNKSKLVDVRIIAATNKDIKAMIKTGQFREDLYFRLNVVPIEIPPLRDRKDDIPFLIRHFLDRFNKKYKLRRTISTKVIHILSLYSWPGNIRELENIIERMVVSSESNYINTSCLPPELFNTENDNLNTITVSGIMPIKKAVCEVEKQLICRAYACLRNTYKVAELLGVNQSTIVRKMKKYNLRLDQALFTE